MKYLRKINGKFEQDSIDLIIQNLGDICLELEDAGFDINWELNKTQNKLDYNLIKITRRSEDAKYSVFNINNSILIETTLRIEKYLSLTKYKAEIATIRISDSSVIYNYLKNDGFYFIEHDKYEVKADYNIRFLNIAFYNKFGNQKL